MSGQTDILLKFYEEHATQARHNETQRERMTTILLLITAVLVGWINHSDFNLHSIPAALFIIGLGIYGILFSLKHYERFHYHSKIMSSIRDELDSKAGQANTEFKTLRELRDEGRSRHADDFQLTLLNRRNRKAYKSKVSRWRLHIFWAFIPLTILVIGIALSSYIAISKGSIGNSKRTAQIQSLVNQVDILKKNIAKIDSSVKELNQ